MRKILSGRRSLNPGDFIFEANIAAGSAFQLPLPSGSPTGGGVMGFTVDWGDGSAPFVVNAGNHGLAVHTYASAATYTIKISGPVRGWKFGTAFSTYAVKMNRITQWGDFRFTETETFRGCSNMISITANDTPRFDVSTSGNFAFFQCTKMSAINRLEDWNVNPITNMRGMFGECQALQYASSLANADISLWDVSNVSNMRGMFDNCISWNGHMFKVRSSTNDVYAMFEFCRAFNNDGNADINNWQTQNISNFAYMFSGALNFNQNISGWNTGSATRMDHMFGGNSGAAMAFNQPIGSWNVSNVTQMGNIFTLCNSFDQDLSNWDLNSINTYNATYQILTQAIGGFGLSTTNYDALLVGWDTSGSFPSVPTGSVLNFGSSQYTLANPTVVNARNSLIAKWGGISDGGGI